MARNFFIRSVCFLLICLNWACKDELKDVEEGQKITNPSAVSVTPYGFLKFESQVAFENYMSQSASILRSTINGSNSIKGFCSLNSLKDSIYSNCLRSSQELPEEASVDEYRLSICQDILEDSLLMNVMDTTLRISIGDNYYKITSRGTYCAPYSKRGLVDSIASGQDRFKQYFRTSTVEGVLEYKGVLYSPIELSSDSMDAQGESLRSSIEREELVSQKLMKYNMNTSKISMSNWWIFGFSHSSTRKYDSKHRLEFKFYNKNFFFWKKAGFSLSVQKKRKILFCNYWHTLQNISDNERVIGFFNFDYTYSLNPPLPPLTGRNPYPANVASISSQIGGAAVDVIIANVQSLNMFGDLGSMVQTYVVDQGMMTKSEANRVYKASYDEAINQIRRYGTSIVARELSKTQKDPMRLIQAQDWDGKHVRQVVFGEKNLGHGGSYDVTLNFSWGITVAFGGDSWSVKPYTPTDLTFNSNIDFYGAVKYQNKWLGIRFKQK